MAGLAWTPELQPASAHRTIVLKCQRRVYDVAVAVAVLAHPQNLLTCGRWCDLAPTHATSCGDDATTVAVGANGADAAIDDHMRAEAFEIAGGELADHEITARSVIRRHDVPSLEASVAPPDSLVTYIIWPAPIAALGTVATV